VARRRAGAQTARALLEQTAAEVASLPGPALRAIGPVLFQAERELAQDLAKWLRTVENGAARFGAQQYRVALVQIRQALRTAKGLNPALFDVLNSAGAEAGSLALGHLARQAEQFSMLFEGSLRPMPIRPAAVLAEGRKALIPRFRASAQRYGEYVTKDIQRELAVGVARGETFDQLTRRLMRHGGPKGMVTVRGIEGDRGAVSEHIAEGLFRRYRSRAETVVRTEVVQAYNVVAHDALAEAHAEDPGYLKRWDAALDWRLCPLCRSLDGAVAPVDGLFPGGYKHAPAHPRCRCALTPWHEEWGTSVRSAPPEPVIKKESEAEKKGVAHEAEVKRRLGEQDAARRAREAELERRRDEEKRRLEAEARERAAKEAAARALAMRGPSAEAHLQAAGSSAAEQQVARDREARLLEMQAHPPDIDRLAAAIGSATSKQNQAIIREELDRIVAHEGARRSAVGFYDAGSKEIAVDPRLPQHASAAHYWNGHIGVNPTTFPRALEFLEGSMRDPEFYRREMTELQSIAKMRAEVAALRAKAPRTLTMQEIRRGNEIEATITRLKKSELEMRSMNDLVHETYHGHSPITPQVYKSGSVGMVAEEVSTELAARATMERRFNIPDPFHFTLATNYEWFINATVEHSARLAGVDAESAYVNLKKASIAVKQDHTLLSGNPEQFAEVFAGKIADTYNLPPQRRAGFIDALKKAFENDIRHRKP
jgi:SPP1 gp7 family putative phage head morphogenesis protein